MYDRPFHWWVQSVMPLVFDDSLSYYEVLAKLTKYIEGLTGDVEQIEKILGTIEGIEDITQFTEMLESIKAEIGNLSDLSTQSKTNLVSAINEVALKADIAYWKPPTGIPESDLSQSVQDKLNRTGEVTKYIINNKELKAAPSNNSPADLGLGTYTVPTGGIPWGTLSQDVRDRINAGGSGTGGTTDYTDLNNKPQINGHTLNAGNNTSESLGLGTYSKPSDGIPESDLSAEVQEKLNTSGGIADNQQSFVASRDYEAGELVYINGVLYKTKYKILTGTTMIPGNNIKTTDISAELEKINSNIDALQSGAGPDSWTLATNVSAQGINNPTRFFEYFNAIGGENYLFIVTPTEQETRTYEIKIIKRDGTVVKTETVYAPDSYAQYRFTFTPVDTGEYYCTMRAGFQGEIINNLRVEIEYTESQGISELWAQVNKANQLEPRVGALETLVSEQETELERLNGIPGRVTDNENSITNIEDQLGRLYSTYAYELGFTQGSINMRGANVDATNRVRTGSLVPIHPLTTVDGKIKVIIAENSNLKVSLREYNGMPIGISTYTGRYLDFQTSTFEYDVNPEYYYRLVVGYIDDSNITPSEVTNEDISLQWNTATDLTVSQSGKPADAYETRQLIERNSAELNLRINNLENNIDYREINRDISLNDLTFVRGSITTSNGQTDDTSENRARTSLYLTFYGAESVKVRLIDNNYQYAFRFYNIKTNAFLRSDSTWRTGDSVLTWNNDEVIRVVIRRADNGNINNVTLLKDILVFDYTLPEIYSSPNIEGFGTNGNEEILAAKTLSFTDGTQPINEYYIVASPLTRIMYKTKDFKNYEALCVLPFAFIDHYAYGVTYDDNVVAVFTIQCLYDYKFDNQNNGSDTCRKPAYVFLKSDGYQSLHKIDLSLNDGYNPTGWFNNSSFYSYDGGFLFCEYTRNNVATANVWKVTGDISDPANWIVKMQLQLSGVEEGLEHMHCLLQDPYTGILYMSTGDDNTGARTYYSNDLGENWVLLHSGEEKYDRYVNLVFTKDYIYYATDSTKPNMHYLYRTVRGANGIMSFSDNAVLKDLTSIGYPTYATVYLPTLNKFFLAGRYDVNATAITIVTYDIDNDTIDTIDTIDSTASRRIGFRCKYIDYVSRDNIVRCGFASGFPLRNGGYPNYFKANGNRTPYYSTSQCNNMVLHFGEDHVSYETIV